MKRTTTWMVTLALALTLAACGKKDDKAGGGKEPDEADQFLLKSVKKDLEEVKQALAKGEDAKYSCVAAKTYGEELTKNKIAEAEPVVKELTRLCDYDVPLAALERATQEAEQARKEKPDDDPLSACYSAEHDMAMQALTEAGLASDDKVKAVAARWDAACPAKK